MKGASWHPWNQGCHQGCTQSEFNLISVQVCVSISSELISNSSVPVPGSMRLKTKQTIAAGSGSIGMADRKEEPLTWSSGSTINVIIAVCLDRNLLLTLYSVLASLNALLIFRNCCEESRSKKNSFPYNPCQTWTGSFHLFTLKLHLCFDTDFKVL